MNKMELEEVLNTRAFVINSVVPKNEQRPKLSYYCRPPNEDKFHKWLETINNILESQLNFGVALENPGAYLRELRDPAQ